MQPRARSKPQATRKQAINQTHRFCRHLEHSGYSQGTLKVLSRCSPGALQVLSRCSQGSLKVVSRSLTQGTSQGALKVFSRYSQGTLKVLSRCSQGTLKVLSAHAASKPQTKGQNPDDAGTTNRNVCSFGSPISIIRIYIYHIYMYVCMCVCMHACIA